MKQTNRTQQIILWIIAALTIFVVLSIFGWKVLYGVIIPQANNLSEFSVIGIFLFAFIAGLIANFGPCSLGVLPAYMAFYLGTDDNTNPSIRQSLKLGTIASLGVVSFFIILGILFATVGTFLAVYASQLKMLVAVIIFIVGIYFFRGKSIRLNFISSFNNWVNQRSLKRTTNIKLFSFGVVYGAGGLMCFLPIFLPLVFLPLVSGEFTISIISFLIFSLAQALFIIAVTALVGQGKRKLLNQVVNKTQVMKKIAGVMLILTSIWMFAIFFIWGM